LGEGAVRQDFMEIPGPDASEIKRTISEDRLSAGDAGTKDQMTEPQFSSFFG